MITPPICRSVQSPNYNSRGGQTVRLIVVHDCEGNENGAVSWFADPRSQVSAHAVLAADGKRFTRMVDWRNRAWHACAFNSVSEGIEMAGFSAKGFDAPEWDAAAALVAWRLKENNLPPVWAHGGNGQGFTSHFDLGAAGGGHTDPTTDTATWLAFTHRVETAYAEGVAEPQWDTPLTAQPPARPADYTPHASVLHGFETGTLEWVQSRLNALGYNPPGQPLIVDGIYGPDTWNAVARYQMARGLSPDGNPGPLTIAALEKDAH